MPPNADVSISHLTSVYLVQLIICQDCPRERRNLPRRLWASPLCVGMICYSLCKFGALFAAIIVRGCGMNEAKLLVLNKRNLISKKQF